jgi:hypothetical protein
VFIARIFLLAIVSFGIIASLLLFLRFRFLVVFLTPPEEKEMGNLSL